MVTCHVERIIIISQIHCNYIFIVLLITHNQERNHQRCDSVIILPSARTRGTFNFQKLFWFLDGWLFCGSWHTYYYNYPVLYFTLFAQFDSELLFVILCNIGGLYKLNHKLHFPRYGGS